VVKLLLQPAHLGQQIVRVVGGHLLGDLVVLRQQRLDVSHALLDVAENGLALIEHRLLAEHADGEPRQQPGIPVGGLFQPGHHPQQGGLPHAVRPDDADLRAGQERQGDVVEDDLVAVRLPHGAHLVDELGHVLKRRGTGHADRTGRARGGGPPAGAVPRARVRRLGGPPPPASGQQPRTGGPPPACGRQPRTGGPPLAASGRQPRGGGPIRSGRSPLQ
jgi:hypothetical protein